MPPRHILFCPSLRALRCRRLRLLGGSDPQLPPFFPDVLRCHSELAKNLCPRTKTLRKLRVTRPILLSYRGRPTQSLRENCTQPGEYRHLLVPLVPLVPRVAGEPPMARQIFSTVKIQKILTVANNPPLGFAVSTPIYSPPNSGLGPCRPNNPAYCPGKSR